MCMLHLHHVLSYVHAMDTVPGATAQFSTSAIAAKQYWGAKAPFGTRSWGQECICPQLSMLPWPPHCWESCQQHEAGHSNPRPDTVCLRTDAGQTAALQQADRMDVLLDAARLAQTNISTQAGSLHQVSAMFIMANVKSPYE